MARKTLDPVARARGAARPAPSPSAPSPRPEDKPAGRRTTRSTTCSRRSSEATEAEARPAEKPADEGRGRPGKPPSPPARSPPKDKDLDSLLEKLGDDRRQARPRGTPSGPGGRRQARSPTSRPDKPTRAGRSPTPSRARTRTSTSTSKRPPASAARRRQQDGEDERPALQVIKEMREVEERLGKPDTGEETRKKQAEIVKKIETADRAGEELAGPVAGQEEEPRDGQGQATARPAQGRADRARPAATPRSPSPQKPTDRRSLAGGKELWGDLPPEVRQDMDNVMKEGFLPSREELIRRYYLSLSKKKATRGE